MTEFNNSSYTLSELGTAEAGNFVSIAGGCHFHQDDNHACIANPTCIATYPFRGKWNIDSYPDSSGKGKIIIGNDIWIGEGVRVMSGVHIGDGSIIGAGSVVTRDVSPYSVVAGNPARIVKMRFRNDQIEKLLQIKWWLWPNEKIRENIHLFTDIEKFLEVYA